MNPKKQPHKKPSLNNKSLQKKQKQEIVPIILVSQLQKKYNTKFIKQVGQSKQQFENVSNIIRAKFKRNVRVSQRRKLINGKQDILVNNVWTINKVVGKEQQWVNLIQMMEEIYCTKLTISRFIHQKLLSTLSMPLYKNLNYLNLNGNKLNNVQALCSIDASNLANLDLSRNDLRSVRSLIKLRTSNLKVLNLDGNNLFAFDQVGKMEFGKSNIQTSVQFYSFRASNNERSIIYDVRFVSKLQRGKTKRSNSFKMLQSVRAYKKMDHNWLGRNLYITFSDHVIKSLCAKFQAKRAG